MSADFELFIDICRNFWIFFLISTIFYLQNSKQFKWWITVFKNSQFFYFNMQGLKCYTILLSIKPNNFFYESLNFIFWHNFIHKLNCSVVAIFVFQQNINCWHFKRYTKTLTIFSVRDIKHWFNKWGGPMSDGWWV